MAERDAVGRPEAGAEATAGQVRVSLESADLEAYASLLDPDVRWGVPGDPSPACRSRAEVLAWYGRGRDAGVRASVDEVIVRGERIVVGLIVTGTPDADVHGGKVRRWQVCRPLVRAAPCRPMPAGAQRRRR